MLNAVPKAFVVIGELSALFVPKEFCAVILYTYCVLADVEVSVIGELPEVAMVVSFVPEVHSEPSLLLK